MVVGKLGETTLSGDTHLAFNLWVVKPDGTSRGVLKLQHATATEYPLIASAATRIHSAISLTSVAALSGDRIVMEIGLHGVTPAAEAIQMRSGDPTATADFALTSALTTDLDPWFELSQTLTFGPLTFSGPVTGTGLSTAKIGSKRGIGAVSLASGLSTASAGAKRGIVAGVVASALAVAAMTVLQIRPVSGSVTGSALSTANLTTAAGPVALNGVVTGSGVSTATITMKAGMGAQNSGSCLSTAAMAVRSGMGAVASGSGVSTSSIGAKRGLGAFVYGSGMAQGVLLEIYKNLNGSVTGSGLATASISSIRLLNASIVVSGLSVAAMFEQVFFARSQMDLSISRTGTLDADSPHSSAIIISADLALASDATIHKSQTAEVTI